MMRSYRLHFWILTLGALASPVFCQEMGRLQTFGSDGRLFSAGPNDYFLLSRQSYVSEDSSGYEGQIRQVKKYPGGGYEIKLREYIARCVAPFDNMMYVVWYEAGQREQGASHSVDIKNPGRFPGLATKDSYNLYWAACHGEFRKFK
jgi:hypothetical protein